MNPHPGAYGLKMHYNSVSQPLRDRGPVKPLGEAKRSNRLIENLQIQHL